MLKSEFIELGGRAEDYATANNIYITFDLWLDRHAFMPWWHVLGGEESGYNELQLLKKQAEKMREHTSGLFSEAEIMARMAHEQAKTTQKLVDTLTKKIENLQKIADACAKMD